VPAPVANFCDRSHSSIDITQPAATAAIVTTRIEDLCAKSQTGHIADSPWISAKFGNDGLWDTGAGCGRNTFSSSNHLAFDDHLDHCIGGGSGCSPMEAARIRKRGLNG
jgi:hypothetical protein